MNSTSRPARKGPLARKPSPRADTSDRTEGMPRQHIAASTVPAAPKSSHQSSQRLACLSRAFSSIFFTATATPFSGCYKLGTGLKHPWFHHDFSHRLAFVGKEHPETKKDRIVECPNKIYYTMY